MRIVAWPARKNANDNPYQSLLYDELENFLGCRVEEFAPQSLLRPTSPDILHIHWPDSYLLASAAWRFWPRLGLLRALALLARARGTLLVWTVHNLRRQDTNATRLDRYFWDWFLNRVDGVIHMTEYSAQQASVALPDKPYAVIRHGHYRSVQDRTSQPLLPEPGSPIRVITFGKIGFYKRVSTLVAAFVDLPPGTIRLEIAGRESWVDPDPDFSSLVESMPFGHREFFDFTDRLLPDVALVSDLLNSELAVFPYSDVLNSGAAIYALSVGRPILVPNNGSFAELARVVGPEWVGRFDYPLTGKRLEQAAVEARAVLAGSTVPDLSELEWDLIAEQTVDFFGGLLAQSRSERATRTRNS